MRKVPITFAYQYPQPILRGHKTRTLRYGWEKPIEPGDVLLMRTPDGEHFANALCDSVRQMTAFDAAASDLEGHRNYASVDELLTHLRWHYRDANLTPNSDLTDIGWEQASDPAAWRWEVMAR